MPEHMATFGDLIEFCGFSSNRSLPPIHRFIFSDNNYMLRPCTELLLVYLNHIPILVYSLSAILSVSAFQRIGENRPAWRLVSFKFFTVFVVNILLISSIVINSILNDEFKSIKIILYSFLWFIWLINLLQNFLSVFLGAWIFSTWLINIYIFPLISSIFLSLATHTAHGIGDFRTIFALSITFIQISHFLSILYEWYLFSQTHDVNESEPLSDETSGFFSRTFFCWTNSLIKKGYNGQLNEVSDLIPLPSSLNVERVEAEFMDSTSTRFVDNEDFALFKTLLVAFGISFIGAGILKLLADLIVFSGPLLLQALILCFDDVQCTENGYIYGGLMIMSAFICALLTINFNYYVAKIGIKVRAAVSIALYDKLLCVPLSTLSMFTSGEVLNFMSSDVDRIVNFCNSFHSFWCLPLQLIIALYFLYHEVELAFLAGLFCSLLLLPVNKCITVKIGDMSRKLMHFKDQRMKLVNELVHSIRSVKLSNLELEIERKITQIRQKELNYLRGRKYLDALCVYLWASAPLLITASIFTTYTLILHRTLTAAKIFTSLALVNILIIPLNAFPWVLSGMIEAYVSLKRLNKFFALRNIDIGAIYSLTNDAQHAIQIERATFFWRNGKSVGDITVDGSLGSIIGICGPVGSGKSTILLGIIGETGLAGDIRIRQSGVRNGFAYVSQQPWLCRGTIRENIICDKEFNEKFYRKVLYATALDVDIEMISLHDNYEIGDGGRMLSGGQRARIALARAVYQDREVYLLDDPLASVDVSVGKHIWQECILGMLKNRGKAVFVVSHNLIYLKNADQVILIDEAGKVVKKGKSREIITKLPEHYKVPANSCESKDIEILDVVQTLSEEKEVGQVRFSVYGSYIRAAGIFLSSLVILSFALMQGSKNASDWWLSKWPKKMTDPSHFIEPNFSNLTSNPDWNQAKYFLYVYLALAAFNTIFALFRAFLFAFGGIVTARKLHSTLLHRILKATVSWWESTPSGRIINRICSDIYTIDDSLPFVVNIFLASLFNLFGAMILTCFALPTVLPVAILLFLLYYTIQRYYRFTTCAIKRLTSLSLSPLYGHISDTIAGLSTIHAFRFVESFMARFRIHLSDYLTTRYSALASSQWLVVRLEILGAFIISCVSITAVLQHNWYSVDARFMGLVLTYVLSTSNLLSALFSSLIECETAFISVERVVEYAEEVPMEENYFQDKVLRNVRGQVRFEGVSLRYSSSSPVALDDITFSIERGTRVAIVGRTGSGKSSLVHALLRVYPLSMGKIFIDDIDIHSVELHSFRSVFGVATQTPFIFSGTLRENLTFGFDASCNDIDELVNVPQLQSVIIRLGGLDGIIEECGANLSVGEKQIISICRIVLSKPKIVIFDEATAHMDYESYSSMNKLVRSNLPSSTIISILHQTQTLNEYDKVFYLDKGCLVWEGTADQLSIDQLGNCMGDLDVIN